MFHFTRNLTRFFYLTQKTHADAEFSCQREYTELKRVCAHASLVLASG